jgi:3-phosphoshikimate 1-carboxyvinyltransferase
MLEKIGNNIKIKAIKKEISKKLTVPGSKSITNRALLVGALNKSKIKLKNVLISDDTTHMLNALKLIGFEFTTTEYSLSELSNQIEEFYEFIEISKGIKDNLVVEIGGTGLPKDKKELTLYTGNSGTTMRFLSAFVPLLNGKITLDGDQRMRERPIGDLTKALRTLGIDVIDNNGYPPIQVNATGSVKGGETQISGNMSSQYISGLMLSAPYYSEGLTIKIQGELVSKPFVDMTAKVMENFNVKIQNNDYKEIKIPQGEYSREKEFSIEPDLTNAFYFLSIPCITGGEVYIYGIGKDSIQGDLKFTEILKDIGSEVEITDNYIKVSSDGKPRGNKVLDMNDIPDLVQTMAIISLFADGPIEIRNVSNLRVKETDRIKALCNEIKKLGGEVEEYPDGLKIIPKKNYIPAKISTYNDHRMAMSFALAGLAIDELVIENYRCTSKTFPNFWDYLEFVYI